MEIRGAIINLPNRKQTNNHTQTHHVAFVICAGVVCLHTQPIHANDYTGAAPCRLMFSHLQYTVYVVACHLCASDYHEP